jgi:hypothetical protein
MPLDPSDLPDERMTDLVEKQVVRYDAIVARLANNGVQVKTWCVTTVAAVSALAVNNHRSALFAVGLGVLVLFMALDVQYLWLERRFRDGAHQLVTRIEAGQVASLREFFTNRPPPRSRRGSVLKIVTSFAILPFYGGMAVFLIIGLLAA